MRSLLRSSPKRPTAAPEQQLGGMSRNQRWRVR
jgi:hypothetical protein